MTVSKLKPIERRLLEEASLGHVERRIDIARQGERYRIAPFTWGELRGLVDASDEVLGDAVAVLAEVGMLDTTRKSSRVLKWFRINHAATFYFITKRGHQWLEDNVEFAG